MIVYNSSFYLWFSQTQYFNARDFGNIKHRVPTLYLQSAVTLHVLNDDMWDYIWS